MGAAARLGLELRLALELLALRAAELPAGLHLAIALDVAALHAEGPPFDFPSLVQVRCHRARAVVADYAAVAPRDTLAVPSKSLPLSMRARDLRLLGDSASQRANS